MNIIISLIYAPLVFFSLRYFDIQKVSIFIFVFSSLWLLFIFKNYKKESMYPILYMLLAICTYFIQDFLILKAMPLIISITFTSLLAISYLNKNSIILYFAKKFSKKEISKKEQEYIHKSTLFWIIVSCINIFLHINVFMHDNINFWIYYSSLGWYFIFILAGILQFLHKKYFFLKDQNA